MCLHCLFGAPVQLTYTPSAGYRAFIPDMPAVGAGPTIDAAFDALIDDLVLWTDWLDEQYPDGYGTRTPPVDPRLLWRVLRPRLRRQIGEPVGPRQERAPAHDLH